MSLHPDLGTDRDLSEGEEAETEVASDDDVTPGAVASSQDLDDAWMYKKDDKDNAAVAAKVEEDPIKLYLIRATREIAQGDLWFLLIFLSDGVLLRQPTSSALK